jgi:hypothetical protein
MSHRHKKPRLRISAAINFTSKYVLMVNVDSFIYLVVKKKIKIAVESRSKRTVVCQYLVSKVTKQEVKPAACARLFYGTCFAKCLSLTA